MRLKKKLFFATLFIVDVSARAKLTFFHEHLDCNAKAKRLNGFLSYYFLMLIFYRHICLDSCRLSQKISRNVKNEAIKLFPRNLF